MLKTLSINMLAASALLWAGTATADDVVADDLIVQGDLCVGAPCINGESFGEGLTDQIKLKGKGVGIVFDDTEGTSVNDWALMANAANEDSFFIGDLTAGTVPFKVIGNAPDNSLFVAANGNVGLGTTIPVGELHIRGDVNTVIRLGNTTNTTDFSLRTLNGGFSITNNSTADSPSAGRFIVTDGAVPLAFALYPTEATVNASGRDYNFRVRAADATALFFADALLNRVGLGTDLPEELLHIQTNTANTDAFALFDANGAGSDAAFRLRQNGTTPTTWEFRNQQDSGRLNVGIAGGNTPLKIDNAANNNLLKLGRNGKPDEVVVTGKLLVNNTEVNVPDYVFADDYALRPLAEVRAFIDTNSHLPEVPSEADIKANGLDMTAMQMTLLKKVEELTLYTLEQEEHAAAQDVTIATQRNKAEKQDALIASLIRRIELLEAR